MSDDPRDVLIPSGVYCYGEDGTCPFWSSTPQEFPDDALVSEGAKVAYCRYLGKSDIDLKSKVGTVLVGDGAGGYRKVHPDDLYDYGLLWDQCKECGINDDECDPREVLKAAGVECAEVERLLQNPLLFMPQAQAAGEHPTIRDMKAAILALATRLAAIVSFFEDEKDIDSAAPWALGEVRRILAEAELAALKAEQEGAE